MSRSMILKNTSDGEELYIPIATESVYINFWQPLIRKHNEPPLYSIDGIAGFGYDINNENLNGLFRELKLFRKYILQSSYEDEIIEDLIERVDFILEKIEKELDNKNISGYVG